MSLQEFQRATAELIASPERCLRAKADFDAEFAVFDLTDRERRRLLAMLHDPGMSANCMLYRVNRLVPILEVLPQTWRLLGSAAKTELQAFWRSFPEAMPQYADEARRFGVWLEDRIGPGACLNMLHAELAAYDGQLGALVRANDPPR
jgi:hypothetical protein